MSVKSVLARLKLMAKNPSDIKYVKYSNSENGGIVLVIHESKRLGASLLLLRIAEEMVKQGEKVYIISKTFGELNAEYAKIAPVQIVLNSRQLKNTLERLKQGGFDRILVNTVSAGDVVPVAKDKGFYCVSLIHELEYVIKLLQLENKAKLMIENSDEIVFSTSVAQEEVLKYLSLEKIETRIKPQGIYYRKPAKSVIDSLVNDLLVKYPAINNKFIVIGVGNTTFRKGFDIFVDTAEKTPEALFLWCGSKENYYNEVMEKRELPNFIYLGKMNSDELAGVYQIADVMLMSSRKDTLPSVIFESLLFGVPVIGARDSGGIIDIVNDSNGVLTRTSDADEFTDAIRFLMKDNNYKRMSGKISEMDLSCFSFENYVKWLLELYPQEV